MRKILAITIICFLFLLIKNENANSKSNCRVCCKIAIKKSLLHADIDGNNNDLRQYDGFFIKL